MVDDRIASSLADRIRLHASTQASPVLVALDGRSGAGKSTLAAAVRQKLPNSQVIEGDTFYAGGTSEYWDKLSAQEKASSVIGWRRQRPVLTALAEGKPASWHGYDWEAFDGRLEVEPTTCEAADIVILEGAYSARPELSDLLDLRILLEVETSVRHERLGNREGDSYRDAWFARWDEAEEYYFGHVMSPRVFDLVI